MKSRLAKITGGASAFPLLVLFGLNCVDELDQAAFGVLLPNIRDSFGLSIAGVLAVQAFVQPVAIGLGIFVAFFADRGRRTRIAAIGGATWAVFSVFTGFAINIFMLSVARIGAALGKSVNQPTHNSLLSDYYPVEARSTVYSLHGAANPVGLILGPLTAGAIAIWFSWRVAFLVSAIPTAILVLFALRLKEPKRGVQDRLALGAEQTDAETEETPPTLAEAFRMLFAVKSLRRIYTALPFIGASGAGAGSLLSLFWADVYNLNELQRGLISSLSQPVSLIGLAVFAPMMQRLMNRDPALAVRLLGMSSIITAASYVVIAFSPNVAVAILGALMQSAVLAALLPGVYAIFSVVIPAKVRSLGFISGLVFAAPGAFILIFIGAIGDTFGLRIGILVMIPLYVGGFLVIASAGKFLADDIHTVRVQSMAEQEVRKALTEGDPKLLLIRDLDVGYDSVQVLFGVDIEVAPGEIVALLGTNGAGKSTLLRAISGQTDPMSGAIYFDGIDITHVDPVGTFALGIVQMPGGRAVFPSLTVEEHMQLAGWSMKDDPEHVERATKEMLEIFPRLQERWDQPAGNLSGGEQQQLALAMALVAKPKLLMIDELSLGLAPLIVEQLLKIVSAIRDRGTTIILVEQSVNVALTVAETAYFMEKGEIRFTGPTTELLQRPDILRSVFLEGAASRNGNGNGKSANGAAAHAQPAKPKKRAVRAEVGEPVLVAAELTKSYGSMTAVNEVSLELRPNEILGIIGPNGAGKTTLFDLISGFVPRDRGALTFQGIDISDASPDTRARLGLGRSFQDARLFPALTVRESIALSLERHLDVRDPVAAALHLPAAIDSEIAASARVDELIDLMGLDAFADKFVSELSTGSRRIVDLACIVAHEPSVILFDEPSSGIAQRETEALGPLLTRIRDTTGASLLVIEHDMPLITSISDRLVALNLGAVLVEGLPDEVVRHPDVVSSYLGSTEAVIARSGAAPRAKRARRTPVRTTK